MKKTRHIIILISLTILLLLSFKLIIAPDTIKNNSRLDKLSVGDAVVLSEFGFENDCTLESKDTADVTGDGIDDGIYLVMYNLDKTAASVLKDNYIIVKNGSTKKLSKLGRDANNDPFGVYVTELQYADINGDGVKEIIVTEDYCGNGGSGSYGFTVLSFKNSIKTELLYTATYNMTDNFNIDFNVTVSPDKTTVEYAPLNYKRIIEEDNTQKFSLSSGVFGISKMKTTDYDNDGISELECYQYVSGESLADCIGYGKSIIKYNSQNNNWEVINFEFLSDDEYNPNY